MYGRGPSSLIPSCCWASFGADLFGTHWTSIQGRKNRIRQMTNWIGVNNRSGLNDAAAMLGSGINLVGETQGRLSAGGALSNDIRPVRDLNACFHRVIP